MIFTHNGIQYECEMDGYKPLSIYFLNSGNLLCTEGKLFQEVYEYACTEWMEQQMDLADRLRDEI